MKFDWNRLRFQERLALLLRQTYEDAGFQPYRMGRFEEYGLYQENRRFLTSDQILTFTDLDGRLLALKPDVTLSIAKNAVVEPGTCGRFYYHENVSRPSRSSGAFREIRQMGVECIGAVDAAAAADTAALAVRTLSAAGQIWALEVGHMGFVLGLLDAAGVQSEHCGRLLALIRDKNAHELRKAAEALRLSPALAEDLQALFSLNGPWREVLDRAAGLARNEVMGAAVSELRALCGPLSAAAREAAGGTEDSAAETADGASAGELRLDLSLVNDMDYYNGIVMQGFLIGLPRPVLRGGQYDPLAARFRPGAKAIGFALYLDELDRLEECRLEETRLNENRPGETRLEGNPVSPEAASPSKGTAPESMVSVALPKGRLGDKVYNLLAGAGYGCPEDYHDSRKLVVENRGAGIRYFLVKPSDVAIYVEHGAADVGIVGKDILEESAPDVYELLDTGLGRCRVCVAGPVDFQDSPGRVLRVATKFVNIAKRHFASRGREIDIIHLNGSIELAPLLGLSDVIVDIVETGTTLRENRLRVIEEFMPVSARFIANRSSLQFKRAAIETLVEKLRAAVEQPK